MIQCSSASCSMAWILRIVLSSIRRSSRPSLVVDGAVATCRLAGSKDESLSSAHFTLMDANNSAIFLSDVSTRVQAERKAAKARGREWEWVGALLPSYKG
uniref:Uncharacterized protein n=1 Tax=Oryza rufipogon TaxID=4529 RepID=A0A0E0R8M3_ORYRU